MRVPSLKTLREAFGGKVSEVNLAKARASLVLMRDYTREAFPDVGRFDYALARLNEVDAALGGFGVEYLASQRPGQTAWAYYVNKGDTYSPTVLVERLGSKWGAVVSVTSWGDWVEAKERRGVKF